MKNVHCPSKEAMQLQQPFKLERAPKDKIAIRAIAIAIWKTPFSPLVQIHFRFALSRYKKKLLFTVAELKYGTLR